MLNQLAFEQRKSPTTKEDILRAMVRAHEHGAPSLTRRDIAALVARKVTPRLITLIEELHEDGKVKRGTAVWPNGAQGYVYAAWGDENGE